LLGEKKSLVDSDMLQSFPMDSCARDEISGSSQCAC
jgi:hypothetical protein